MTKYITEYNGIQFMDKTGREKIKQLDTEVKDIAKKVDNIEQGGPTTADNITIKDANNHFNATNVEGALNELFQSASNGKGLIATAITGKGVDASSSDTFTQLATKYNK